jgi:hypothetical protein
MRGSCEANSQRTLGDGKPDWLLFYALALFRVGWVDAGKAAPDDPFRPHSTHRISTSLLLQTPLPSERKPHPGSYSRCHDF